MGLSPSHVDQLHAHAAELADLAVRIHGEHTDQAQAAADNAGPAMMTTAVDPQRPMPEEE